MFDFLYNFRKQSAADTSVKRKPSLVISLNGLIYCGMTLFMIAAAENTRANLLYGIFGLMLGIFLITWALSRIMLLKLRVTRVLPESAVVGQSMTINYELANGKRFWPSLSICISELDAVEAFTKQPYSYLLHAASRMTGVTQAELIPRRRGLYTLDRYQISTSFPFGLISRALIRRHSENIIIYPALAIVHPEVLNLCRSAEKSGSPMRPRRGGMDEFYGVKEFRSGDNPRWIYWRRSARAGTLVSKEMTQVSPPRLTILVDHFVKEGTVHDHLLVERTIAMGASLAGHALEAGMAVGLLAWSGEWISMTPQRGKRHRRDILAVLAKLPLNKERDTQSLLDYSHQVIKSGTTPVLCTSRELQMGLVEHFRSGMVVISSQSPQSRRWFRFDEKINFARCMPPDQQPRIGSGEGPRARGGK